MSRNLDAEHLGSTCVEVQHKPDGPATREEMPGTHGLLIHREHVERIRVFETVGKDAPVPEAVESAAAGE